MDALRRALATAATCLLLASAGRASADAPSTQAASPVEEFRRPTSAPHPRANPPSDAKVELGKVLFFDPRLSGSGTLSCASCHNPGLAWTDGLAKGHGHLGAPLARHTPTILNVAWGEPYFWDGRAATLEEQVKGPLLAVAEMNTSAAAAVARLDSIPGYAKLFSAAFPAQPISIETIAAAIASYERTVVSGKAPFDRWAEGAEAALSDAAKRGFALFNGKARCANCHSGWRFTDDGFHDIGLADQDPGRAQVAPGIVQLQHAFKTPTLRNVDQHAPYMHDGSIATLAEVIDHYDRGFVQRPSLDVEMVRLDLTADEKRDLLALLDSFTSVDPVVTVPTLPH